MIMFNYVLQDLDLFCLYSTVTLFARFLCISTFNPLSTAT